MNVKEIHEAYHSKVKLQKRIISRKNFTYRNSLDLLDMYLKDNSKILDVGSGVGTLDFYLAKKGCTVTGIDISTKAVRVANQNARIFGLSNLRFYIGNVNKFKFSSKFDLILCSEIIEHVEDDSKLLKDLRKHLNEDGIIFLTTPLETAPLYKLGLTNEFDRRVGHIRRYTLGKLKVLATQNKLKIVDVYYSDGIFRNIFFVFPFFDFFVRIANKFEIFSDMLTLIDVITLRLFGPTDICLIMKKV